MEDNKLAKRYIRCFDPCRIIDMDKYSKWTEIKMTPYGAIDMRWVHFNEGELDIDQGIPCWKFLGHYKAESDNLEELIDEWIKIDTKTNTYYFYPTLEKIKGYWFFKEREVIYGIIRDPREPSIFTLVCKLTEDGLEVLDYPL